MSIGIYNLRSSIAQALLPMLPVGEEVIADPADPFHDRFLFCSGYLSGGGNIACQDREEVARAWFENFSDIAAACDLIFEHNSAARVCIIGSESGFAGSHDMAYAGAKAAMHLYIEKKRLNCPDQQLVGIAPTVIWDSGMTQRRSDLAALTARAALRRKLRWVTAIEVARAAHFLLYVDEGYTTNTILGMNGGNW